MKDGIVNDLDCYKAETWSLRMFPMHINSNSFT